MQDVQEYSRNKQGCLHIKWARGKRHPKGTRDVNLMLCIYLPLCDAEVFKGASSSSEPKE